jgi:hypothetical protein
VIESHLALSCCQDTILSSKHTVLKHASHTLILIATLWSFCCSAQHLKTNGESTSDLVTDGESLNTLIGNSEPVSTPLKYHTNGGSIDVNLLQHKGCYGLSDHLGDTILPVTYDTIWLVSGRIGHRQSYLYSDAFVICKGGQMGCMSLFPTPRSKRNSDEKKEAIWTFTGTVCDTVYESKEWEEDLILMKDGKYGMFMRSGFFLPPIYDVTPEYVQYKDKNWELIYEFWYVTKDGFTSVANFGETYMPFEFRRDEITYLSDAAFKVQGEGEPLRFYDGLSTRLLTVKDSSGAVVPAEGKKYVLEPFIVYHYGRNDQSLETDILIGIEVDTGDFNPYLYSNPLEDLNFPHYVVIDRKTGHVMTDYQKPGCKYSFQEREMIAEIETLKGDKGKVRVTLYNVLTGVEIHSYKMRKTEEGYRPSIRYRSGYYEIMSGRTGLLTGHSLTKGYINSKTMKYTRKKKGKGGAGCDDCTGGCGMDVIKPCFFWLY